MSSAYLKKKKDKEKQQLEQIMKMAQEFLKQFVIIQKTQLNTTNTTQQKKKYTLAQLNNMLRNTAQKDKNSKKYIIKTGKFIIDTHQNGTTFLKWKPCSTGHLFTKKIKGQDKQAIGINPTYIQQIFTDVLRVPHQKIPISSTFIKGIDVRLQDIPKQHRNALLQK